MPFIALKKKNFEGIFKPSLVEVLCCSSSWCERARQYLELNKKSSVTVG